MKFYIYGVEGTYKICGAWFINIRIWLCFYVVIMCSYCATQHIIVLYSTLSAMTAMKARATKKKGRGVTEALDEGQTGGALRC